MSNQPKPQDILNSIGAMAEMTDAFYKKLINRGFDKGDALYLSWTEQFRTAERDDRDELREAFPNEYDPARRADLYCRLLYLS